MLNSVKIVLFGVMVVGSIFWLSYLLMYSDSKLDWIGLVRHCGCAWVIYFVKVPRRVLQCPSLWGHVSPPILEHIVVLLCAVTIYIIRPIIGASTEALFNIHFRCLLLSSGLVSHITEIESLYTLFASSDFHFVVNSVYFCAYFRIMKAKVHCITLLFAIEKQSLSSLWSKMLT